MLIDWFTVFAQIVNFLILVVLLRIFLYGRVVKAMKVREKTIADRFVEAKSQREKADQLAKELEDKKSELAAKADEFVKQARQEAVALKEELVLQARQDVDSQKDAWQKALLQDREAFLRELAELVSGQVTEICKKTLADLADENLVDRLAMAFAKKLENLSPDDAAPLKQALAGSNEAPLVQSSLTLSKEAQEVVIQALKNSLGIDAAPRFERDDKLVLGIALYCNGKRLALSAQDYLNSLLEKAGQRIIEETGQDTDQKPPEKEE
jgi:F-type H+-transporting ATPase subunit b